VFVVNVFLHMDFLLELEWTMRTFEFPLVAMGQIVSLEVG